MESHLKTSHYDKHTGRTIYYISTDTFYIYTRTGTNKKKLYATCNVPHLIPQFIADFHKLTPPEGYRKYLERVSDHGTPETLYSLKGIGDKVNSFIQRPPAKKKRPRDIVDCKIIVHTLPEKLFTEIKRYNYDHLHFPTKNTRAFLLKILLGHFFSLNENDKKIFSDKARARYEDYTVEIDNGEMELL